jgi:hypothetical protein
MARSEEETNHKEVGSIDHDSYVDCRGSKPLSHRERILFAMSTTRTICALLGAVAQAISLYMIYLLRYHPGH